MPVFSSHFNHNFYTVSFRIQHIAFCDDDPDDHEIFATIMASSFPHIKVYDFFKCEVLLGYLKDESKLLPDIIFLDYNMPGNAGNECLKEIKKMLRPLHIPVIIYSTSDYKKFIEESYRHGAYRYLVKPSNYNQAKTEIIQLINAMQND